MSSQGNGYEILTENRLQKTDNYFYTIQLGCRAVTSAR
jgi:hypothetical protein